MQRGGAACLSVLTDGPSFQGADAYLVAARDAVALPCLRKDFLVDPWQVAESRALGADAILVILAMVDDVAGRRTDGRGRPIRHGRAGRGARRGRDGPRRRASAPTLIGVNNRDLRTFVTDLAVTERLAAAAPANALLVTESGISTPADARPARARRRQRHAGRRKPDAPGGREAATRALLGDLTVNLTLTKNT